MVGFAWLSMASGAVAQLSVSAQLRTRTELRAGQGAPLPKGSDPAFFTSQRSRLNVGFAGHRFKTGLTLQDVRVWGQDGSTINRTVSADNNGLKAHEAWAEIQLTDTALKTQTLLFKIGRQELVYDDQRLLGNLDWLQQARSHDAAVLKYEVRTWSIHAGAAFNQNRENASGTTYNSNPAGNYPGNTNGGSMYKSMQYLHAAKKLNAGQLSFLFFTDQFSKYRMDTVNNIGYKSFQPGSWARATTGIYFNNVVGKWAITSSAYYQFGKTFNTQKLRAVLASAFVQRNFNKQWSLGAGVDYTSGGNSGNSFDPLYGTPHKFWGLMDYFYVASSFGKGGLTNSYIKTRYKANDRLLFAADLHQFSSATAINYNGQSKRNFGQEADLVATYSLTKTIGLESGYAHFFATPLLNAPAVKNVANGRTNADWAYLMINIRPEFLFK
ncbi:hypothetical protein EXU57_06985 [Segetibacter sp. 3557_3]|nr:hypothetical protein EXU57_06985 [Segetibacter sp. 3557_3]